jgi:hypothetical protein
MSKRFLVNGQDELRVLEEQTKELQQSLETTRMEIMNSIRLPLGNFTIAFAPAKASKLTNEVEERQEKSKELQKAI